MLLKAEPNAALAPPPSAECAGDSAHYEAFGQLWRRLHAAAPAQPLPGLSARLAYGYARTIVRYWELLLLAGALDTGEPLILVDLSPGRGRFAWQLMRALREQAAALPYALPALRYWLCAEHADDAAALGEHPYFSVKMQHAEFEIATRDALLRARRPLVRGNPVVAVEHGLFAQLESALLAVHYGGILEARARLADAPADCASGDICYAWPPARLDAFEPAWRATVDSYRASLSSAPVLIPCGAFFCVDRIAELSAGRFLLLGTDQGVADLRDIRMGACAPPAEIGAAAPPMPANHHALAHYLSAQGAALWQEQLPDGAVFSAALRSAADAEFAQRALRALAPALDALFADGAVPTPAPPAGQAGSPQACLGVLRASRFDPGEVGRIVAALQDCDQVLGAAEVDQWRQALACVWANYLPWADGDGFYGELAWLALCVGHLGLAIEVLRAGIALHGDNPADLHQLAICLADTGRLAQALDCVRLALECAPEGGACAALHAELEARMAARLRASWFREELAHEGALRLEPLAAHHAPRLYQQYRDPQISVMTSLPALNAPEQAPDWIAEQSAGEGRMSCAVMHEQWGFVGVASLRSSGDAGYFHFWIGADHQGRGYGPGAGALLMRMAAANGVRQFFTSVFQDNLRSLRALRRMGFALLPANAEPPDDKLVFLHRGEPGSESVQLTRLGQLCAAIDSPIRLAAPFAGPGRAAAANAVPA
jgi:RimJ/RimL family protein N-acetyltransferase